jgi:hypothetical protein
MFGYHETNTGLVQLEVPHHNVRTTPVSCYAGLLRTSERLLYCYCARPQGVSVPHLQDFISLCSKSSLLVFE